MPTDEPRRFGLKESTIARINELFAAVAEIDRVIIYGSRALGTYRNGSDIDLAIQGKAVTHDHLLRLETSLDDLLLPYTIDLSLFHQLNNPDLRDHIERVGVVFYERQ